MRKIDEYTRTVLPYLKESYFSDPAERVVFNLIRDFITNYNNLPTHEALVIMASKVQGSSDDNINRAIEVLETIDKTKDEPIDIKWLTDETEKFCRDKALYNAMAEGIAIMNDKTGKKSKNGIPGMMTEALAISFDQKVGHDYFEDAEERFDSYHNREAKIPFHLDMFNYATNGGVELKSLNILQAVTNVGKTAAMCDLVANYLKKGYDVLYITGEMSDKKIGKRIDANLLDVNLDDVESLTKDQFKTRFGRMRAMVPGKLIIKEFPTAQANVNHFRHLLSELKLKKNFVPQVVIFDYLGVFAPSNISKTAGMYEKGKAIAEELRGLMCELNMCGWSAIQTSREGKKTSDPGMEHAAESWGIPSTVDFHVVMIVDDALERMNQIMWKQEKSRYGNASKNRTFITGYDRDKQRFFNVQQPQQPQEPKEKGNNNVVMDNTKFNGWSFDP